MAFLVGYLGKVTLGSSTVVGMGTWTMSGITTDQMEYSQFGDNWKVFEFGMKDGGQITFNGFLDKTDSGAGGQWALQKYNMDNTDVTSLRLYVDNTSWYEPCATTSYFSPGTWSSAQETIKSHVNITAYEIGMDKAGLATISFTAKVSGVMVLA